MSDESASAKEEGVALGRRCITAAKQGDEQALLQQVCEYGDQPDVLEYCILYMAMFAGDMLDAMMSDVEWRDFLMAEETNND